MPIPSYTMIYNGVILDLLHPEVIARDHIYSDDGTTYLYTRWTFDGIFVYNPQSNAFAGAPGQSAPGTRPVLSDVNVRDTLRVQRAVLQWIMGQDRLLISPVVGMKTDVRNGPVVERANIVRTIGVKTLYINFRVVTYVNECPVLMTNPQGSQLPPVPDPTKALLSHRWKRWETTDQDYYSTVVTEGQCVFRGDILQALAPLDPNDTAWPAFPDQWRKDLFHPIPNMFKRGPIEVMPGEDGLTYNYRFVDSMLPFRGPNPVTSCTRIEAFHTSWTGVPGLGDSLRTIPSAIDAGLAIAGGNVLGGAITAVKAMTGGILPKYRQHIIVRAWGPFNSLRGNLQNAALRVVFGALGTRDGFAAEEFFISHELSGKYVQVEFTQIKGIEEIIRVVRQAQAQGQGVLGQISAVLASLTGFEGVTQAFTPVQVHNESVPFNDPPNPNHVGVIINPIDLDDLSPVPPPPNSNGTRGQWLGKLLAQALSGQCQTPPMPPQLPVVVPPTLNEIRVQERSLE